MNNDGLSPSQRRFLQTYQDRYADARAILERAREAAPGTFATMSFGGICVAINIEIARTAIKRQTEVLEADLRKMGIQPDR
jgi:hypothetical protein